MPVKSSAADALVAATHYMLPPKALRAQQGTCRLVITS
jgi:hypothetical protein